jgi:hypothetical protein
VSERAREKWTIFFHTRSHFFIKFHSSTFSYLSASAKARSSLARQLNYDRWRGAIKKIVKKCEARERKTNLNFLTIYNLIKRNALLWCGWDVVAEFIIISLISECIQICKKSSENARKTTGLLHHWKWLAKHSSPAYDAQTASAHEINKRSYQQSTSRWR